MNAGVGVGVDEESGAGVGLGPDWAHATPIIASRASRLRAKYWSTFLSSPCRELSAEPPDSRRVLKVGTVGATDQGTRGHVGESVGVGVDEESATPRGV